MLRAQLITHSSLTTGNALKLAVPVCRTDVLRRFLGARRVLLWNALPADIIECNSLTAFKRGLNRVLRDKLFEIF